MTDGLRIPCENLATLMIIISDNTAATSALRPRG
jgi:beta-lactamase class A